jgi:hypothetical protein
VNWQCGSVKFLNDPLPKLSLCGQEWDWSGFKFDLFYKLNEIGARMLDSKGNVIDAFGHTPKLGKFDNMDVRRNGKKPERMIEIRE